MSIIDSSDNQYEHVLRCLVVKWAMTAIIGVIYGGYGGYPYPPLFGVGGTVQ